MTTPESAPVLGIDLGTSNSVAAVYRDGRCEVVPDKQGLTIQPSVVSFHPDGSVLVGTAAKKRRLIDPPNTILSAKRLIGRPFHSNEVQQLIPSYAYAVTEGPRQQPVVVARGRRLTVSEISALVLRHMKQMADRHLGSPARAAVLTVPANFNDAQRQATKAAGRLAGLEVMRIINEPTAAALAYGHGQGMDEILLVYDFGGGTFDVTVLRVSGEIFEVLSTAGDSQLGGDDIDERVTENMVRAFMQQYRYDLRHNEVSMLRLRTVAEKIKIQLSKSTQAAADIKELAYGPGGKGLDLTFSIDRPKLEGMIADQVERTLAICDEALALARLKVNQIKDVILVGGSTRIPLVREKVHSYFGRPPQLDLNPDEVVAMGAAIQGAALMGFLGRSAGAPSALLLDVTPRALGVATVGGYTSTVIPRNAQLPTEQNRVFATGADYQTAVNIKVCQGESKTFDDNVLLGELQLSGLTPAPRGQVRVEVTFEIDTDGILRVQARDPDTGNKQQATMQVVGAPSQQELTELMEQEPLEPTQTPPELPES
jgi:molecular chaperone DnaK